MLTLFGTAAYAQAGVLDTTFGGDGKVTTNFPSGFECGFGVTVQSADGKIVVSGESGGGGGQVAVARYNTDGRLDTTFGGDGKVTTNFTPGPDSANDMAIQPADGKIVAAGRAAGSGGRFALARYNTDGTLDTTFSSDGKVTTNFSGGDDFIFGVEVQPGDGKIVVTGRAGGSGGQIALARYNTDGTLDTSFSGDGKVTTNFTSGDDRADLLAIHPVDGTIVAAGTAGYYGNAKFAVVRYNSDGTLDTTFSGDGKVTTSITPNRSWGFVVAIQPSDSRIVAGGQAGEQVGLVRYNTDGTLDSSFSGDGKVTINFTSGTDYADDIVIQPLDGKIVTAGSANFFRPDAKFALARVNADGTLDSSFSGDGKVTTNLAPGADRAFDVDLQPSDGKIVASGCAGGSARRLYGVFGVARYLAA
jgi:uncharacterized delta-60 repeat protein